MKKIAILIAFLVLASTFGISLSSAGNSEIVVTGVNWFGSNSTEEAVPGMNNVPLFITVVNNGPTIYNFTAFIYLKYPFSYGYVINNTKQEEKTVIALPELPSNYKFQIMQLVNISPYANDGIYVENLFAYGKFSQNYPLQNLSTSFYIPLEGNVNLFVSGAYIGENGQVINPVPGENPLPLTLILGNSGNSPVLNVTFHFIPSYPFYGNDQKTIITAIPAYGYVPITFMVNLSQNIKNGYYPEKILFEYYNVSGALTFNFTWSNYYSISVIAAYVGYGSNIIEATGGMRNVPITIEIMNSGTEYVSDVNLTYAPQKPFYGQVQNVNLPVLAPFRQESIVFFASIENGTDGGIYNQTLLMEINSFNKNLNFTIDLNGYSSIMVDAAYIDLNGTGIAAGPGMKNVPLTVIVSNGGNAMAGNITFTYIPSYPFYGNIQSVSLPALPPLEPLSLTFIVSIYGNASDGLISQMLSYSYCGYSGKIIFHTGIYGYQNILIQGYFKNPAYVYTNQTFNTITFYVVNAGTSPAYNVTVYAASSMNIVNTPLNIAVLPPHVPLNFTIFYNSPQKPGDYVINFFAGNRSISVPVSVLQSPVISVIPNFPALTPGASKVQITFYLVNHGPGTVQSMQIHFVYPQVIDLYVSSSNPLGGLFLNNVTLANMNPGYIFTLPYIVDVADNAVPGSYSGELVMLIFENNTNRPILETFYFTFQISAPFFSTNGNTGIITLSNLTIIILVIIIIVLVALYIRQVRKKS